MLSELYKECTWVFLVTNFELNQLWRDFSAKCCSRTVLNDSLRQAFTGEALEIPLEHHPHGHCHPPSFNEDHLFMQVLFIKCEQTRYDAEHFVCLLESTNSPRVLCQPLSISFYPHFGKRTTVWYSALLLSLHNFPHLVALTFVVWTLQSSLKNTWQTKNQCPAWPLLFPGLPQTRTPELGFKCTIPPTGLPHSRNSSFPLGWGEPNGSGWMLHVLQLNTRGRRL